MNIIQSLRARREAGKKSIAILIDPDKVEEPSHLNQLINLASENCVDFFFVGGSLVTTINLSEVVKQIKQNVTIPVILFPGNSMQIDSSADAILFLSLISGRNPELLIGQHVIAAPVIRNTKLEVIPTGYMLINSGRTTSVAYISNTMPIPDDKYSLAACTAMAGEMLGLQAMYLDAGSGAEKEISARMIASVRKAINVPLIVGGGINTSQKAFKALEAGADMIVIGNALEKEPELLIEIADKVYEWNQSAAGQ
ncbi:geranylgeranylglyceryl/heptaprenylglyceryl phosphate synthase [Ohtaekwangia koreensis]|uniref:Geranylgeranylglyceryl phosphate synthase n=1 Tax=Ohtaekwangia koreensis TaxID=688867 RepID=A0A1T5LN11_9BACT|nr:geranylgeranylglyceryl/heptaprenylglyceryl phosphate synthase [Ohtaekwangia koreensis]SKC76858.1 putative glycerol-1-phosphate prenyltransferase [Ohtaekwangia koreensis]